MINSSNFSKLLEYSILPVLKNNLKLSSRQFGFRPGTNYQSDTNVQCAMSDLTKTFHRMNFNIQIAQLNWTHLLDFMLKNLYAALNYNGLQGRDRLIGNSVGQGEKLSSLPFSFYINQVVDAVSGATVSCRLRGMIYKVICYAD